MTFPLLCSTSSCSHKHGWLTGCFRGTAKNSRAHSITRPINDIASMCMLTVHVSPSIHQYSAGPCHLCLPFYTCLMNLHHQSKNSITDDLALRLRAFFLSGYFRKPSHHRRTLSPFWTLPIKSLISSLLLRLTTLLFRMYPTSNRSGRSSESWALIRDFKSSTFDTHTGLIFLKVNTLPEYLSFSFLPCGLP